jgi:pimeloyl-ACP methyl ester carboxylesterase
MRLVARAARQVPAGAGPLLADIGLDTIRQDPGPSAAVLHGLFFGRTAPHKALRRTLAAPTLVIGHQRDPIHPFSDSDALVAELPNATLVQASSILELRISPQRLTGEIGDFLDTCWSARRRGGASRTRRVA